MRVHLQSLEGHSDNRIQQRKNVHENFAYRIRGRADVGRVAGTSADNHDVAGHDDATIRYSHAGADDCTLDNDALGNHSDDSIAVSEIAVGRRAVDDIADRFVNGERKYVV